MEPVGEREVQLVILCLMANNVRLTYQSCCRDCDHIVRRHGCNLCVRDSAACSRTCRRRELHTQLLFSRSSTDPCEVQYLQWQKDPNLSSAIPLLTASIVVGYVALFFALSPLCA